VDSEESDAKLDTPGQEEKSVDFFSVIWVPILKVHNSGLLPLQTLLIVIIYNFIVFSTTAGYEIYVLVPILLGLVSYASRYWKRQESRWRVVGVMSVGLALLWDSVVSISYIPSGGRGYSLESIPTLILDVVGLFSLLLWLLGKTGEINQEV
jgi:hypothetical protein